MKIGFQKEFEIVLSIQGLVFGKTVLSFKHRLNYDVEFSLNEGGIESMSLKVPSQEILIPFSKDEIKKIIIPELPFLNMTPNNMQPNKVRIQVRSKEDLTIVLAYVY